MLSFRANSLGPDFAERVIKERFRVHSVFNTVCNLQAEDEILLSLVTRGEAIAPNTLWIQGIHLKTLQPGMPLSFTSNLLEIGNLQITLPPSIQVKEKKPQTRDFRQALLRVKGWLETQIPGFTRFDGKPARILAEGLLESNDRAITAALRGLIGVGGGLTPWGDDYAAGALLAFVRATGGSLQLSHTIQEVWQNTNSISKTMLWYACQGKGPKYLTEPVDAILANNPLALNHAGKLLGVGSSSGRYLLAGILTGCEIFWLREHCVNETGYFRQTQYLL